MDFNVKKLSQFTVEIKGLYSKEYYRVVKGGSDADCEKRSQRPIKITVNEGRVISQEDPANNGMILCPMNNLDPETLRNISAVATKLADMIEEEKRANEPIEKKAEAVAA